MTALATGIAAILAPLTLAASGLAKLRDPHGFFEIVAAHRFAPRPLALIVAVGALAAELGIGLAAVVSVLLGRFPLELGFAAAALLACLAIYGAFLLVFRPGVPCGCFGQESYPTKLVPLRAGLLAVLALGAAFGTSKPTNLEITDRVVLVEISVVVALFLFALPLVFTPMTREQQIE